MSLKHKILGTSRALKKVSAPELKTDGEELFISRMNGEERCRFQAAQFAAAIEGKTKGEAAYLALQPLLISMTLCDSKGMPIFDTVEDVQKIDSLVLERIGDVAMEFNVLTEESRKALEKKETENGSGTTSPINFESPKSAS